MTTSGRPLDVADDLVRMDEALAVGGGLGREPFAREGGEEVSGRLDRVDEDTLCGSRVGGAADESDRRLQGAERLGLDLAAVRPVEGVGDVGAELREIEPVRAAPDFLVRLNRTRIRPCSSSGCRTR